MANSKDKKHQRSIYYSHRDPSHKYHSSTLQPVGNAKETKQENKGRKREEARRSKDASQRGHSMGRIPGIVGI